MRTRELKGQGSAGEICPEAGAWQLARLPLLRHALLRDSQDARALARIPAYSSPGKLRSRSLLCIGQLSCVPVWHCQSVRAHEFGSTTRANPDSLESIISLFLGWRFDILWHTQLPQIFHVLVIAEMEEIQDRKCVTNLHRNPPRS